MPRVALVRYGMLKRIAEFVPRPDVLPLVRRKCVVRTPRGLEIGRVLAILEREEYPEAGTLVRMASREDRLRGKSLAGHVEQDLERIREATDHHDGFKVVATERLFDGETLLVYYLSHEGAEVPVILRELRKELGIEVALQQVGSRQRARVSGGCGACGRALCCASFLRAMEPVSMRMARVQGLDLSPDRTAGVCGRLKCCLRYENPSYEEHRQGLPRVGWLVQSRRASGSVLSVDTLRQKVLVKPKHGRAREVHAAEIEQSGPIPRTRRIKLPQAGELEQPDAEEVKQGWSLLRLLQRIRKDDKTEEEEE